MTRLDLRTGRPIWIELESLQANTARADLTAGEAASCGGGAEDEPSPAGSGAPRVDVLAAAEARPLEGRHRCQVAVVGAGVTGALLVDQLWRHGFDAMLVDCRPFGRGSTAASTSLLICEPDTHFFELEQRLGTESARRIHALGVRAIDNLCEIDQRLPGGCDFRRRPVLYFASTPEDVPLLKREKDTRDRMSAPVEFLSHEQLHSIGYSLDAPAALKSPNAAEINAYRMTRSLIADAVRRGVRTFGGTRIAGVDHSARVAELTTSAGATIHADSVVFATGYEAYTQLDEPLGSLSSTWAFASEPVAAFPGWPERMLIWETARPYVYLRTTLDNRVIMGGCDEPHAEKHDDPALIREKTSALLERFHRMFPDIPLEISTAWAGVFGSSHDGLPFIGRRRPDVPIYYALGYGGNGITFSAMAAEMIVRDLLGDPHPDRDLFRFDR